MDDVADQSQVLVVDTRANCGPLWHQMYGHLNHKYLSILKKHHMVNGLPSIQEEKGVCATCLAGK